MIKTLKLGLAALLMACGVSVKAQSTNADTGLPTQGSPLPTAWGGLTEMYQAFQTATNWTIAVGNGRGFSGKNNNLAFVDLAYNIVTTSNGFGAGLIVGMEDLYGSGKPQVSTVAGGITLNGNISPFGFLGWNTFSGQIAVSDLMATPRNGNPIGNLVVTTFSFHSWTVKNFSILPTIGWENRQGQGRYDGNYGLLAFAFTRVK